MSCGRTATRCACRPRIRRFGGERYASTELDLMGPEIWRMLKQAERGLAVDEDVPERRVRFLA